jgi:hypothetical protein
MTESRLPGATADWPKHGFEIERKRTAEFLVALMPREAQRAFATLEYSDPASILRFDPGAVPGETLPFLGVRLRVDQPSVNDGARAEVALSYPFSEGDTVTYRWDLLVPSTFVNDHPRNFRNTIAQWHDRPDVARGECWRTKPRLGSPVSLRLASRDGRSLQLSLHARGMRTRASGAFEIATIPYDRWIPIRVRITWSRDPDRGAVAVSLDDDQDPALVFRGFTMNNHLSHYLKIGLYRHEAIRVENRIYLRQLWCETLPGER